MRSFSILSNRDFTTYANDTTPNVIVDGAKNDLAYLLCWFACNQVKVNPTIHLIAIN